MKGSTLREGSGEDEALVVEAVGDAVDVDEDDELDVAEDGGDDDAGADVADAEAVDDAVDVDEDDELEVAEDGGEPKNLCAGNDGNRWMSVTPARSVVVIM